MMIVMRMREKEMRPLRASARAFAFMRPQPHYLLFIRMHKLKKKTTADISKRWSFTFNNNLNRICDALNLQWICQITPILCRCRLSFGVVVSLHFLLFFRSFHVICAIWCCSSSFSLWHIRCGLALVTLCFQFCCYINENKSRNRMQSTF